MIHMLDSALYPSYSLYEMAWVSAYIAGAGLITYCGLKIHSAIERYRIGKRGDGANELAEGMDEIGTDSELKDTMNKVYWA